LENKPTIHFALQFAVNDGSRRQSPWRRRYWILLAIVIGIPLLIRSGRRCSFSPTGR